jgi:hypothetical protein
MDITKHGVLFEDYVRACPDSLCRFIDSQGATLLIPATTLIRMYELVKFDLSHRNMWDGLMRELDKQYPKKSD